MPSKRKTRIAALFLLLSSGLLHAADPKIDVRMDRGTSAYENKDFLAAMDHFASALLYGIQTGENVMYPAAYLCGMWYNGRGVAQDTDRAIEACYFVAKGKSRMQLDIFQGVLEKNGSDTSPTPNRKAAADAAIALRWYIDNQL